MREAYAYLYFVKRQACSKFLRQTFHEFAKLSRQSSPWAAAYYRLRLARGKRHHAAVRALAFKWIRVLFAVWKSRQPTTTIATSNLQTTQPA